MQAKHRFLLFVHTYLKIRDRQTVKNQTAKDLKIAAHDVLTSNKIQPTSTYGCVRLYYYIIKSQLIFQFNLTRQNDNYTVEFMRLNRETRRHRPTFM